MKNKTQKGFKHLIALSSLTLMAIATIESAHAGTICDAKCETAYQIDKKQINMDKDCQGVIRHAACMAGAKTKWLHCKATCK